jgi:hypothetical protein
MFDLSQFEKQSKQFAINFVDVNKIFFDESINFFDESTNKAFNIYTLKALEASNIIIKNVKEAIETAQISPVFGSGIKK